MFNNTSGWYSITGHIYPQWQWDRWTIDFAGKRVLMEMLHKLVLRPARRVGSLVLPEKVILRRSHEYVKKRYRRFLEQHISPEWLVSNVQDGPAMSERLRLLTRSLDERFFESEYTHDQFFYESYRQIYHFAVLLEKHGFNFRTCGAILDFGCGSARILRLFRYLSGVRLVGSDANPECIEWCRDNVPGCQFQVNQLDPPLAFSEGNEFDLIISLSVFTHIPLNQQTAWLLEMKRILRPGGILLCTVAGTSHFKAQLGIEANRLLNEKGEVTLGKDDQGVSLSTKAGGSNFDVFQRRDKVIEVFGGALKMLDYIPSSRAPIGQDLLVLQKT
jgi:SAM-dependent methyltransferase